MVRKYIRKTSRQSWAPESMRMAIEAVIKQGISIRRASIENEVPHATLSRKIQQCRCDPGRQVELLANPKGYNLQTVFSKEQEDVLCNYIYTMENQMVSVTTMDVRRLAFQIAEKFNLPHRFNKDVESAGEDWYRGFCKRNPKASIKRTDSLVEKNQGFTKEKVYKFFDYLERSIKKYKFEASNIYNLDEAVITCSLKKNSKISSPQKGSMSSDTQKLVTAQICFSASGAYMPLMLIFPCDKKCKAVLNGAPSGSWAEFDSTGQMQLNIFLKWLKKFIVFSRASKDTPVLLLLDGYKSYLKTLGVLEITQENGIHIICLPSHCTEKLQPIQHSFSKTLSAAYTDEVTKWTHSNPECSVSIYEVYELIGNAFSKISTVNIPQESFRNTGIWPPDRDLFEDKLTPTLDDIMSSTKPFIDDEIERDDSEDSKEDIPIINRQVTKDCKNVLHEPIIIISQKNNQPCAINTFEQENNMEFEEVAENNEMDDSNSNSHHDEAMSPVVIPPEAQLSEVKIEDLQSLMQSKQKLYFYVSPYRLKVSP